MIQVTDVSCAVQVGEQSIRLRVKLRPFHVEIRTTSPYRREGHGHANHDPRHPEFSTFKGKEVRPICLFLNKIMKEEVDIFSVYRLCQGELL